MSPLPPQSPLLSRRRLLGCFGAAGVAVLGVPRLGHAAAPVRIVVLSDFNGHYGSVGYLASVDAAVRRTVELRPDLVISTGDMVAGQRLRPLLTRSELVAMWVAFHRSVSDPLQRAGLPLAVTPGNHDASSGAHFALEREVYREQWLPRRPRLDYVDGAGYPFDYAFRVRDCLFVSIDATFVGPLSAAQRGWVERMLREHGNGAAQRIVFSHVPLWPFTQGREREYIGDPALEQILRDGRVDLYLSGHHHAFYPGHKDGIHLVSQSCAGAGPRRLIGSDQRPPRAITLIEIDGAQLRLAALQEPDFTQPIDWRGLPERVRSKAAELIRADLVEDRLEELPVAGSAASRP